MSSASTPPCASASATVCGVSGEMRARIRSGASSTVRERGAAWAGLGLVDMPAMLVASVPRQEVRDGGLERGDDALVGPQAELLRRAPRDVGHQREAAVEHDTRPPADRLDA